MATVTVLIPHIPIRINELGRAIRSVSAQTRQPDAIVIVPDPEHTGSAATRNRGLKSVTTDFVAFVDDDDELLPHHLDELMRCQAATEADVVYPGGTVVGGHDPHDRFGKPFDPNLLRQKSYIPVTCLARTALVRGVGGFEKAPGSIYDDWGLYLKLLNAGAKFVHHPVKTWFWHHGPQNTSGLGSRWIG